MTRKQIKELAKQRLGGSIFSNQWLYAMLACLIVTVAISVVSALPGIGAAVILICTGPLGYGMSFMFLHQVRTGESMKLSDLLKGFKEDMAQNTILGILVGIFVWLWTLLLVIPGIVKAYAYSMVFYVKADHPEYTWKQCFKESKKITYGHKAELFVLDLSFIGWYIVGALCLGIGTFWVQAYHESSMALIYENIKNNAEYADVEATPVQEATALEEENEN